MSDVRYAPPQARLRSTPSDGPAGAIDVGEAFREAWGACWSNFALLLGVYVVGTLLSLLSMGILVGIVLLVPVIVWGFFRVNLNAIDGRVEFADLFSGFADYGRVLGTMLILAALMGLIWLVGQSVSIVGRLQDSGAMEALGLLVNLAFSLAVMPRLVFAWYFAIDRELGPSEAVAAAWSATTGQAGSCIVLGLLSSVILIMGLLCLVVGVIPATMIVYLMQAAAYRQLAGRQTDAA